MTPFASAAMIPNPRLAACAQLIGEWTTVGRHSMIPGVTLHGRTVFDWHEGGAFVRMHTEIEHPSIPTAVALIGSDDVSEGLTMLYFDERAVSRRFEVARDGPVLRWWRTAPGFSQRFALTTAPDGDTLHGVSELSKDDRTWEQDLELRYTRVA
ncbi:MAG: hypothetical protein ABI542_10265 [Gemmatimonadota bacterium]